MNDPSTPHGDAGTRTKHLKAWTGVIAALAGIVTLGFFLWDRYFPDPFTVKEWAVKANSICDRHIKGLHDAYNQSKNSLMAYDQATSSIGTPQGPTEAQIAALINRAAQDLDSYAGTERQSKADLDALERPEDHEEEVDRLIEAMNQMSQKDSELGRYFETIGQGEVPDRKRYEIENERNALVEEVEGTLTQLGATQCLI
ncbi:hypothetical protein [Streptomyces sp. XY413]|uniref:hypothetical protein n=1 Tax=Streptomyces sp. XY413 TaxID=1519479 RepID=UPI00131ADFAD|nr:hypothetical protein [Streptomyces sp. XY413]